MKDPYTDFSREFERQLKSPGALLQAGRQDATATIEVTRDMVEQRTLAVSARNIPTDYELRYTVAFDVQGAGQSQLLAPQTITLSKDYSFEEDGCSPRSTRRTSCAGKWRATSSTMAMRRLTRLQIAARRADCAAPQRHRSRGALPSCWTGIGMELALVAPEQVIPGSYWGEREAGLIGSKIYARLDTPLHSVLHESAHFICMTPERRAGLDTDAGGDDAEESAVCYLQILLADRCRNVGAERMCRDMDEWGYSFRLGSAARWFAEDAQDARAWLVEHGLIDAQGRILHAVRRSVGDVST